MLRLFYLLYPHCRDLQKASGERPAEAERRSRAGDAGGGASRFPAPRQEIGSRALGWRDGRVAQRAAVRYDEGVMAFPETRASELSILEQIVLRKRAELLLDQTRTPLEALEQRVKQAGGAAARRGFRRALERRAPAIIAEIKRSSPSRGRIAERCEPAHIARQYEAAGASALSVLTDKQFFEGSLEDLEGARAASSLPVLRKDFTLDVYHLWQAAAHGADAVLLIVAILPQDQLRNLIEHASDLALDAVVEVHDESELDRALEAGAELIGVNNRDLQTFEVSLDTSLRLARRMPPGVLAISESGIRSAKDILRLSAAGFRAFLIGESLMRHPDPGAALASLLEGVHAAR